MARTFWRRCALLLVALLGLAVLVAPSAQAAATNFIAYPALPALPSDGNYTVTVDGQPVPVSTYGADSFVRMAYTGTAQIKVVFSAAVTSYQISPKSSPPAVAVSDDTLTFNMAAGKKYVLSKVNGGTTRLDLFADVPESGAPVQGAAGVFTAANGSAALQAAIDSAAAYTGGGTVYVPAGDDVIVTPVDMKSNVKLYLAPGAIVDMKPTSWPATGMLRIANTSNVKIFGRGTFYGGTTSYPSQILGHHNDHLNVYDVAMVGGKTTFFQLSDTADSGVHNVKILVGHGPNLADGLDMQGAFNVILENSFILSSDDVWTVGSGADAFDYDRPINTDGLIVRSNIEIQTTSGTAGHFTTHIPNQYVRNVLVEGNTVVTAQKGFALMALDGYATVSGITIRNNSYEEILVNNTFDVMTLDTSGWGSCANGHFTTASGTIRNVVFDNNWFSNKPPVALRIEGRSSTQYVDNIDFNNLHIAGVLVTNAAQGNVQIINPAYVTNVRYTTGAAAGMAQALPADPNMIPPQQVPTVANCNETIKSPQPDPQYTLPSIFPPVAASY